ncbi:ABC transporter substrate-binding protein [Candidatus Bipolaricaulota bacterium]|nr:ABC transporter substrate-binding protein [Candidatus Bipolaricaulota bacterium]
MDKEGTLKRALLVIASLVALGVGLAQAKTTVEFWHAMSGSRLAVLEKIVSDFNATHPDYEVRAVFTGTYEETLTKFIAAYRAGTAPNFVQVYEVGTQTMIDSGAIVPVYQIPGMLGETWDWAQYVRPILLYYSVDGNLWSFPFNSSTSMLYYNKDHFRQAGLDPNKPPTTWDEMFAIGRALIQAGVVTNVLSFGWPDWQFEQQLAIHNYLYADSDNGRAGLATAVTWPDPFSVKVFTTWTELAREGIFLYGGPEYNANSAFTSGTISMLFQSTSSLDGILKTAKFEVGTSFLPRFPDEPRGNSVVGGGSLWVRKGQRPEELRAVWEFFKYLSRPEVDIFWHKGTGYFPATSGAMKQLMDEGWFAQSPNHLTAFLQILSGRQDTAASIGVRLGPFVEIRDYVRTALEKAVAGTLSPEAALAEAATNANRALREYRELVQ